MAVTFLGTARSTLALGNDSTEQNLFTIQNCPSSYVNVNIRRLMMQNDNTAVLTAFMPIVKVSRATAISGGVTLDKTPFDTTQTSDRSVVFRAQADETARITATAGSTIWQQYSVRMHTAVEQQQGLDNSMLPRLVANTGAEFILRPGESLLVKVVGAAGTSNAMSMNNWFVECVFEEDALATFAISGTVTLNASPVEGAKVMVIEADDESLTNAFLREVITTDAGGTWASTIRSGKVGAAFVQYTTGGIYYTAPGSPYLE